MQWDARRQICRDDVVAAEAHLTPRLQDLRPVEEVFELLVAAVLPRIRRRIQSPLAGAVKRLEHDPAVTVALGQVVFRPGQRFDRLRGNIPCPPPAPVARGEFAYRHTVLPLTAANIRTLPVQAGSVSVKVEP